MFDYMERKTAYRVSNIVRVGIGTWATVREPMCARSERLFCGLDRKCA